MCVYHYLTPKITNPSGTPQGGFTTKSNSFSHLELRYLKNSNCSIVRKAQGIRIYHSFQYSLKFLKFKQSL